MDNEMIERVAEGLWENDKWHSNFKSINKNHMLWHKKKYFIEQARAAIKAMREPTENMCYAGDADAGNVNRAKACYQSMIDCIIND